MHIAGTSLRPLELWRGDVSLEQARNFGSSLLATAVRLGSGALTSRLGPRPSQMLILYEIESCPFSRLVREALSELDLDALIKPCSHGEEQHHAELAQHSPAKKVPFLIDRSAGVEMGEAKEIVEHLYARYGASSVPSRLKGPLALASSKLARELRGGQIEYRRPSRTPELTLELWNYEGSPYCRMVREQLARFGLAYVSHNLARNSPRRPAFKARHGVLQFPRLHDPNAKMGMFGTDAIVSYLDANYGNAFCAVGEEVSVHPA